MFYPFAFRSFSLNQPEGRLSLEVAMSVCMCVCLYYIRIIKEYYLGEDIVTKRCSALGITGIFISKNQPFIGHPLAREVWPREVWLKEVWSGKYGPKKNGPGKKGPEKYGPGKYGPGKYGPRKYSLGKYGPGNVFSGGKKRKSLSVLLSESLERFFLSRLQYF